MYSLNNVRHKCFSTNQPSKIWILVDLSEIQNTQQAVPTLNHNRSPQKQIRLQQNNQ